jgi:hypothetical protein
MKSFLQLFNYLLLIDRIGKLQSIIQIDCSWNTKIFSSSDSTADNQKRQRVSDPTNIFEVSASICVMCLCLIKLAWNCFAGVFPEIEVHPRGFPHQGFPRILLVPCVFVSRQVINFALWKHVPRIVLVCYCIPRIPLACLEPALPARCHQRWFLIGKDSLCWIVWPLSQPLSLSAFDSLAVTTFDKLSEAFPPFRGLC